MKDLYIVISVKDAREKNNTLPSDHSFTSFSPGQREPERTEYLWSLSVGVKLLK